MNFFIARAEWNSSEKPCKTAVHAKQEINKKQISTQVKTTDMRTDYLPVACCSSEQRLFLTHSLFFCTLQIHTILVLGQK
jgi:hypothetical protein